MGRLLYALFVGMVVCVVIVFGIESIGTLLNPLPDGIDARDVNQVRDYMASGGASFTAMFMVLLAYIAGCFGGAYVATKLAPRRGLMPALVIGQIALVLVIVNLITIPHPIWMVVATLLVPLPSAWAGGRAARARGGMK